MKSNMITERLEQLREELRREHLGAYIFNSSDPHNSEYTADRWKGREWISGFNGRQEQLSSPSAVLPYGQTRAISLPLNNN